MSYTLVVIVPLSRPFLWLCASTKIRKTSLMMMMMIMILAVMNNDDDDEGSFPRLLTALMLETRDRRWAVAGKKVYSWINQHWLP